MAQSLTPKKLSEADKEKARKGGKIPKAPKKPKAGASVKTYESYIVRWNSYVDKVKSLGNNEKAKKAIKLANLKKKVASI